MCYAEPVTQHHALDIPTCLVTITLPITRTHKVLPETYIRLRYYPLLQNNKSAI